MFARPPFKGYDLGHRQGASSLKHGLPTEVVPVSAYVACSKNLKDLNEAPPACIKSVEKKGSSLIKRQIPVLDPAVGLCLSSFGVPWGGGAVSYEPGTPVPGFIAHKNPKFKITERIRPLRVLYLQGFFAQKKASPPQDSRRALGIASSR
jgi:hypothetical protein